MKKILRWFGYVPADELHWARAKFDEETQELKANYAAWECVECLRRGASTTDLNARLAEMGTRQIPTVTR